MAHRRTGWSATERQNRFANKVATMDEAYANATGVMTIQGQNLVGLLNAVKETFQPWANTKGLLGPVRIAYRNYLLEVVKAKNEGIDGEALAVKIKALRQKYSVMGLIEGYLEELEQLAYQIKASASNNISLYAMMNMAKK